MTFTCLMYITEAHETLNSQLITTIKKLYSGYINGARLDIHRKRLNLFKAVIFDCIRVQYGKLEEFIKTACLTSLSFIGAGESNKS